MADSNSANIYPYPFQFDPSQFANKYSPYQGTAIPFPTQYSGTPTDALGNPIQSYLGAQSQAAAAQAAAPQQATPVSLNSSGQSAAAGQSPANYFAGSPLGSGNAAVDAANWGFNPSVAQAYGQTSAAPAPAAAAPAGPDMGQAYLNALSNPGKVTTPGATVPQAPTPTGQSNVLQSFLQNWQNKGSPTTGAGNYNNAGFFNALQGGQNA